MDLPVIENLLQAVQSHALSRPAAVAVSRKMPDGQWETTSYSTLASLAERYAAALGLLSRRRGVIPLLVSRSAHCVAAMIGAVAAGQAFACINTKLRSPQISAILAKTGTDIALVDAAGLLALGGEPFSERVRDTRWLLIRGQKWSKVHNTIFEQLRSAAHVEEFEPQVGLPPVSARVRGAAAAPACCLFTSGSTGSPKGVLISHGEFVARAKAEATLLKLTPRDIVLSILPFSFIVGLNQVAAALSVGAEVAVLDSWLPGDILRAAAGRKVTGITGVPTVWQDFLNGGFSFDRTSIHSALRYITVSGGDLARHHLDRLSDLGEGIDIYKTYGSSEAFRASVLLPEEFAAHRYSVGREAPGTKVYIVREDGSRVQSGESGEVVVTGLGVMMGYLGGEDTSAKLRPNPFRSQDDGGQWAVYSGDLGRLDEGGYLYLEGRRDELVKISGNRVYPKEIRSEIISVDGVTDAEVLAFVDEGGSNRLAAFIVTRDKGGCDAASLRKLLLSRLPSYMLPDIFVFLERLPKTLSGKIDRLALASELSAANEQLANDGNRGN